MANYNIDVVVNPSGAQQGAGKVNNSLNSISNSASRTTATVERLTRMLKGLAVGAIFTAAIKSASAFADALAEVSTLVNTATFDMAKIRKQALLNAAAFGSSPVEQVKAFYQAISAGATSASSAVDILTTANKLAVGGVTNVFTATDGLTSIVNAYGDKVKSATEVSDAMFVAMRAGKTTIDELASSIGKVAPLAAQVGVSFDELVGSVAALTKGGIATTEAVTGVRAILAAVAKPTSEAAKLSKSLGLEFNSAALQAKGLKGFLDSLKTATGGNTDQLAQLFGGVEALVPVLALMGQAGVDLTSILEDMSNKAGATEEAFMKIYNSPGFQAKRLWGALSAEAAKYGTLIAEMLVPAMAFLADNMETIVRLAGVVGIALLAAFSMKVVMQIRAIVTEMIALEMALGATSKKAALVGISMKAIQAPFRILGTLIAAIGGPIALAIGAVVALVAALYVFRDDIKVTEDGVVTLGDTFRAVFSFIMDFLEPVIQWFKDAWASGFASVSDTAAALFDAIKNYFVAVISVVKTVINGVIGIWVGAYRAILAVWGNLDVGFKAIGKIAISALLTIIETGVNKMIGILDTLLGGFGKALTFIGIDNSLDEVFKDMKVSFERFQPELEGKAKQLGDAVNGAFKGALETDWLGNAYGAVMERARKIAADRQAAEANSGNGTTTPTKPGGGGGVGGDVTKKSKVTFAKLLAEMMKENTILKANATLRGNRVDLMEAERKLGRALTAQERSSMNGVLAANEVLQAQVDILQDIEQPQQQINVRLEALKNLYKANAISVSEYNAEIKKLQDQYVALNPQLKAQQDLLKEVYGPYDDLAKRVQALNAVYAKGLIDLDTYNQKMMEVQLAAGQLRIQNGQGTFADGFNQELNRMLDGIKSFQAEAGSIFGQTFSSIADGAANSIGRAIVYSENLGESLTNVARDALQQLISGFIKLGLQWVANQILAQTLGSSMIGVAAGQAAALSAAWSGPAALASLATLGANSGAAISGIATTMGFTKALALSGGGFAQGTDYVTGRGTSTSDDVLAALSVGEGVVSAAANRRNPGIVAAMNSGASIAQDGGKGRYGRGSAPAGQSTGVQMNISVVRDGNTAVQIERLSENDVRIIARQEASAAVRRDAPGVVANDMGNPNGRTSKALAKNTKTERRRN